MFSQSTQSGQRFSSAVQNSLLTARDAFHDGCFYNNTTLLNAGFASAVDALCAVREMVYVKKEVTLAGFKEILDANWSNHEKFRLKILKDCPHYGNGNPDADYYAGMLGRFLATKINGRPNSRGGVWKASLHSARQFIELGKKNGCHAGWSFCRRGDVEESVAGDGNGP